MPPKRKQRQTIPRNAKAKVDRWGADFLSTNPDSPLVSADLIKILSQPETWAHFSQEELEGIGATFPEDVPRNENGSISIDWLRYNNDWRDAVRLWQADLELGRLDPEWLRQAAEAMEDRAAGKFDKFKEEEFEQFWGQKQKIDSRMLAGESAALKLDDLIAGKLFRENDFWIYCRGFGLTNGTNRIDIIKDCKIVGIGKKTLTFAIPPGELRYARNVAEAPSHNLLDPAEAVPASTQEDVTLCTVENVKALETKILEVDGRVTKPSHRNAWKMIRCQRDNQDMGSLFDIREAYFLRTHPR